MDGTNKELAYREFVQREEMFRRAAYNPEMEFYTYVMSGDIKMVKELTKENILSKREGWGILSSNELQNVKYHFVITTATIARYCINSGLDLQTAYNLSDYYISKADKCKSIEAVAALHAPMCMDYTKRMHELQKNNISSLHITRCIDYIYDNLHTRITATQLADYVHLSEAYLSRLFKQETGMSISDYICDKKIATAKNMLRFSDYGLADIAAFLAFPSQSYFSKIFKEKTGMTPSSFRNKASE